MATESEVEGCSSLPDPSRSCSAVPIHKWTCSALKVWLRARGLSYSGLKKDEIVAK